MDIENSFQEALDRLVGFLPNLLAFLALLIVGFILAKLLQSVTRKILEKVGLDRRLQEPHTNRYVDRAVRGASPSNGISLVVFWLVFIFFLFAALGALSIPAVTTFMNSVLNYLPNVLAAILIFIAAALIAGAVAAAVTRMMGDTPTGRIVGTALPALVMVIAFFMILEQLQIAPEIVRIAFAATMGALALGLALAFGLGGRPVAERMLEEAYTTGRQYREQVKADREAGRDRATATQETPAGAHMAPPPTSPYGTPTTGTTYDSPTGGTPPTAGA